MKRRDRSVEQTWNEQEAELTFGQRFASLEEIFEEEPVDLTTFVRGRDFLNSPRLSPLQYDVVRHLEQIFYPEVYQKMADEFDTYWTSVRRITEAWIEIGKGGGKDYICQVATMRVAYLLNCLNDPPAFFGLPSQSFIHLLNVAANSDQALRVFFEPVKKSANRGWFADKCTVGRNTVQWQKNILQISGHSQTESQEGLNLIMGICDEVDAFKELDHNRTSGGKAQDTADSIVKMIRSSGATRFPNNYKLAVISYPRYIGSPIHKGRRHAARQSWKRPSSTFFAAPEDPNRNGYATWEFNPIRTQGDFASEYESDPIEAAAKYECKPSRAVNPFFRDNTSLARTRDVDRKSPVTISYTRENEMWDAQFYFAENFVPIEGAGYALHADLAIRGDRAGIAMSHIKEWKKKATIGLDDEGYEMTQWEEFPSFVCDFVLAIESDITSEPAREIQIDWYRQLVIRLQQRGFAVLRATADSFQSASTLQLLQKRGIEVDTVSMDIKKDNYYNFRDLVYDNRVSLPNDDLLFRELESLEELNGKIDHTPASTKDEADAVCGSLVGALVVGGRESEDRTERTPGTMDKLYTPPPPAEFALLGGSRSLDLLQ